MFGNGARDGSKMGKSQNIGLMGVIHFKHMRDGKVLLDKEFKNMIVDAGLNQVAKLLLLDQAETAYDYIAIGTDGTAAAEAQTTLIAEVLRQAGTGTVVESVPASGLFDTAQLQTTFTFAGSYALLEVGMFNDATVGVMLCRQIYSVLNVISGDTLQITWKITASKV